MRDFVYDEESLKAGKNERDKLLAEKQRQYAPLIRYSLRLWERTVLQQRSLASVDKFKETTTFQAEYSEIMRSEMEVRAEKGELLIVLDSPAQSTIIF